MTSIFSNYYCLHRLLVLHKHRISLLLLLLLLLATLIILNNLWKLLLLILVLLTIRIILNNLWILVYYLIFILGWHLYILHLYICIIIFREMWICTQLSRLVELHILRKLGAIRIWLINRNKYY